MAEATFSLDLHVLGPPLTFALSQDQTLHRKFEPALRRLGRAPSGGKELVRRGMVSLHRTKPTIFFRLAIQFSETDPRGVAGIPARSRVLVVFTVEGCCL